VICIAATFNAKRDEKAAHEFFRQFRKEGEFFEISHQEVENYFNAIINKQYQAEQKQFIQNSNLKAGDSSLIKVIESNATSNSVVSETCHAALVNDHSPGGILQDSAFDDITIKYQNEGRALDICKHKIEINMMESKARMMESEVRFENESRQLKIQRETLEIHKNALEIQKNALEMQKNALEMQKNALELIALKYSTCQASLQAVAVDTPINSKTMLIDPGIARFFSAKVNSGSLDNISAFDLYSQYSTFHTKGNYKYIQTNTFFGREVVRIDGIQKVRKTHAAIYDFDGEKIKIHLMKSNEYDPEVFLED
jgi:hypothetical protein